MPIDSREKRASAGASGILSLVTPPLPNGAITAPDRLQILGLYSGIAAAAVVIPDYVPPPEGAVTVRGRATAAVAVRGRPAATVETP